MMISDKGLALLEEREGKKLTAYPDIRGIWTIGVGHTASAGPPHPVEGMTITEQQCQDILNTDLKQWETGISALLTRPVTQYEWDALVSLVHNIGLTGFHGSSVLKMINSGRLVMAAKDFMLWDHPSSLYARRISEMKQFQGKLYT